jgi:sugar transferase (PEP-CTERM system associated)
VVSLFRHYAPLGAVLQLLAEGTLYFVAVILAVEFNSRAFAGAAQSAILPAFVFAVLMVLMHIAVGLYHRNGPLHLRGMVEKVLLATAVGFPLAYALFFAIPNGAVAQEVIGQTVLLTLCGVFLLRRAMSLALNSSLLRHRVLVIGTGPDARAVEQSLARWSWGRIVVTGFYSTPATEERLVRADRILPHDVSIEEMVRRLGVDEIIVAVREQRGGVLPLRQILDCRVSGVRVTTLAGFFERVRGEVPLEFLKASWLIYAEGFSQDFLRTSVKRLFDLVVSCVMLVFAAPVMLVTAIAIFLESGAPIIYRQERVGRAGRTFTVLKFRSMRVDAENDGKPRWAQANDVRVTKVGRFIRTTRIDELPQVLNVLRGEMSFVGPRPERPTFVADLKGQIPFYDVRHSVKPGITGWAQVRHRYGASVADAGRKLQFDLYYVKNHSLALDVLILLETVRIVLLREGSR